MRDRGMKECHALVINSALKGLKQILREFVQANDLALPELLVLIPTQSKNRFRWFLKQRM